ncbi:8-oxo-dGTP diphosphatase [Eubacterium uniforme]|uniref:8-oxo-dGTP diphosphatase n=1 Tax=Eubacterium uniforme TaxID=39495 RepID=A0A1T4VX08_9FIRM|nr:NUDIX domain-containing protein [Eubacterium uniforme]SKA69021.1 8-oxo-dGTP diphosphatase [Eubacterium uniforme]
MAKKVKLEKIAIEVNVLITAIVGDKLEVVMTKRAEAPLKGKLEILNTNVTKTESLDDAAKRLVKEVTGFKKVEVAQLGTYGDVKRKPDDRVISVAYIAFIPMNTFDAKAAGVEFYAVDDLIKSKNIAFDNKKMVEDLKNKLKAEVTYTDVAFKFVEEEFTLPDLQRVHEVLLEKKLFKTNFRRKIVDLVEQTEFQMVGDAHRPSRVYKRKK